MRCRKNVKDLTADEKRRFVDALLALKLQDSVLHPGVQSRYDDFVETHLLAMHDMDTHAMRPESWGHGGSAFLPWHRELLYRFEKLLQSIDSSVTIPYWDWTRARSESDAGYPFTHDFLGVDGSDGDNDRVNQEAGAPSPYPYAFDPEAWSSDIEVVDPGDSLDFFQRQFGEYNVAGTSNDAPNLPSNDTVETGTSTTFRAAIDGAIGYLTHRARCEDLHNLVHRWCGGNMLRMTSPNDPVFFLHHANIDRMWSMWQRKVPAGTALYVASSTTLGHKLNDAMLFNEPGDPSPFTTGATPAQVIEGHTMHGDGVWYQSDVPEIEPPAPVLSFVDIPEGLTTYKAVRFKIKGCRPVRFRITGSPTGSFGSTPAGTEFEAVPVEADDFFYGYVWVQFTATAGAIPNSSVAIHAYFIDEEGYYAATEFGEVALGDYTVTLTATTVPRENNSIALVLDRSGSMDANAGGSSTRSQLLSSAIEVFRDLMLPADEVSVTTFDDVIETPIHMQAVSGTPLFTTVDLSPRGLTWIGGGIQAAALELTAATHSNRSMIVLTDGNENVHPYIAELPAGTVTSRTYAIGFGLPGEVSDQALNDITSNTHGDLVITGNLSSEEQRFMLTKYFVQVLAGVTNSQVLLDPQGKLYFGTKDVIPFKVSDADVYVDAILLCPIPRFIEFVLRTPDGTLIKPTSSEPNVRWIEGREVLCYRLTLPAVAKSAAGSHQGTWHAIVQLKDEKAIARLLREKAFGLKVVSPKVGNFLPYSFIVHVTSNLRLNAWTVQEETAPGSVVQINTSLRAYDVPFQGSGTVWAEVTTPDGSSRTIKLAHRGDGNYQTEFKTSLAGIYVLRVMAEGLTAGGSAWTREKTLTAGVFRAKSRNNTAPGSSECWPEWLHCLVQKHDIVDEEVWKRLRGLGIDVKRLSECMNERRSRVPREQLPVVRDEQVPARKRKAVESTRAKEAKPQIVANVKLAKAVAPKPVPARPAKRKRPPSIEQVRRPPFKTMFVALDLSHEGGSPTRKKTRRRKPGGRHQH